MIGLIDTATVYIENSAGVYATVVKSGLRCRLAHIGPQPTTRGGERAELAALRNLIWEPGYVLPEQSQVSVSGVRWNPVAGTFKALRGPTGAVVYRQCDFVRAADG